MEDKLVRIVERACTEAAFRDHLARDPGTALAEYQLTAEERAALIDDAGALRGAALDARLAKLDIREQEAVIDWIRNVLP